MSSTSAAATAAKLVKKKKAARRKLCYILWKLNINSARLPAIGYIISGVFENNGI